MYSPIDRGSENTGHQMDETAEYENNDNALEFWSIELDYGRFPAAHGVLYEKPSPSTVRARITFPRLEPMPRLRVKTRTTLTALCANRLWMRNIVAEVARIDDHPDGSRTMELLLYRKGREPSQIE